MNGPLPVRPIGSLHEMRASHERSLEHDGIPMILGLSDVRGHAADADADDRLSEDGATYSKLVQHYRDQLVPWARDDDEGALINVLQVIGFTSFAKPAMPVETAE